MDVFGLGHGDARLEQEQPALDPEELAEVSDEMARALGIEGFKVM